MQPLTFRSPAPGTSPEEALTASAHGWHGVQLAVLGFIGLCGVLRAGSEGGAGPNWLKWTAAGLAAAALVLACRATYLVARVAFPIASVPLEKGAARLRSGVRQTYVAVGLLAIGAMSAWWPASATATTGASGTVEVRTADGRVWCGEVVESTADTLRIRTANGIVVFPRIAVSVEPKSC